MTGDPRQLFDLENPRRGNALPRMEAGVLNAEGARECDDTPCILSCDLNGLDHVGECRSNLPTTSSIHVGADDECKRYNAYMKTLGDRIRAARKAKKITQASIAKHFGISRVSVTNWESNDTRPDGAKFPDLATLLGVSLDWLLAEYGDTRVEVKQSSSTSVVAQPTETPNARIGERVEAGTGRIPVYGQAVGGVDGEFVLNGNLLYETMRPPSLSQVTKAYAVTVSGDSMSPRYEDGEVAFVDPTLRPRKGSYVVAQIQLEEHGPILAYIKRFVRHTSDALILEQFNPPKELSFAHETVVSVHCIVIAGMA